jgi:hypothetical protein
MKLFASELDEAEDSQIITVEVKGDPFEFAVGVYQPIHDIKLREKPLL